MSKNTTTFGAPPAEEPSILNPFNTPAPAAPVRPPVAAATVATNLDNLAPAGDPLRELQIEELRFRLEEMRERKAQTLEKENQLKNMRLQNMQLIKRRQLESAREKEVCSHRMENGEPYTVGTRDHRGNIIVMCQQCQKEWRRGPMWTSEPQFDPAMYAGTGQNPPALPAGKLGYSPRLPKEIYPKGDAIGGPSHV